MPAISGVRHDPDGVVISAGGKEWKCPHAKIASLYAAARAGGPGLPEAALHDLVCRELVRRIHAALGDGRLDPERCVLRADPDTGTVLSLTLG